MGESSLSLSILCCIALTLEPYHYLFLITKEVKKKKAMLKYVKHATPPKKQNKCEYISRFLTADTKHKP